MSPTRKVVSLPDGHTPCLHSGWGERVWGGEYGLSPPSNYTLGLRIAPVLDLRNSICEQIGPLLVSLQPTGGLRKALSPLTFTGPEGQAVWGREGKGSRDSGTTGCEGSKLG